MDNEQIKEVLEACLLATDGADLSYIINNGINIKTASIGLKLFSYLKEKEI
jgi:hypothetical protein